jgi:myosin-crossreactive antigen
MEDYPTYYEYKAQIDTLISRGELTVAQGVILLRCFNATLEGSPVHVNYLMACTGLNWQKINYVLNGLVLRKGIRKIEEKYYMV